MVKSTTPQPQVNLKEQNAAQSFDVTIRDREHFYKITKWLNTNVGTGKENWTIQGRVLRSLKEGKSVTRKVYIFRPDLDEESSLYLSLL
jgi:hypothetical protein